MSFLRPKRKTVKGFVYEYWSVVENYRIGKDTRQRTIASLGKAPGLDEEERVGWEEIVRQLNGKPRPIMKQLDLFTADNQDPDTPQWATIDKSKARVERLRRFGDIYLALVLWHELGFGDFFREHISDGREDIAWSTIISILAAERFCEPSSELAISEMLYEKTVLEDLLGIKPEKINDDRLYRALDKALECQPKFFSHLRKTYGEMFGITFDVLLYDVTSTYFEGQCAKNSLAARGYSRDSRPDCKQVCIGLVVTPEGLPLAYEIFDGNRTDVTTVEDIFDLIEDKYGKARRIWIVDRGMVSECNLDAMRARGAAYLVGTPRSMLNKYEKDLLDKNWETIESGIEVRIVDSPFEDEEGEQYSEKEMFILCRSQARIQKDRAIVEKAAEHLEKELLKMEKQIDSGRLRSKTKTDRRIGRLFQKYSRAAKLFKIEIEEIPDPEKPKKKRLVFNGTRDKAKEDAVALQDGCYLLRTNQKEKSPSELWRMYIGLVEAEDMFRQLKSPLALRPVYHQKTSRVEAHIMICFLALTMRRALSYRMSSKGMGGAVDKLIREFREIYSMDIVLTAKENTEIRLRVVGTPPEKTRALLHALGIKLPNRAQQIYKID